MLDIKLIRENTELVKQALAKKGVKPAAIDELLKLDQERRSRITELEGLRAEQNQANEKMARLRAQKQPIESHLAELKALSQKIVDLDSKVGEIDSKIYNIAITIPNIADNSVPEGATFKENKIIRTWGDTPKFDFKPKDHLALADKNGWVSFDRGVKITGSAFPVFQKEGARLVRALMSFMIDLHVKKHGYSEIWPPALVNRTSMTGTGQLPKLEEDMYKLKDDDYFLVPTAEVPVTNLLRDEILKEEELPVKYTAYSPCFRREAGSYGKDTKGLSRVHQFDKVEMVKFVKPGTCLEELESLVRDAEEVLQLLEIPHRVVLLCGGELSFAAAKCYDIEAYAPGTDRWFEVSSCSMFLDFQARRINIKYKPKDGGKPQLVHTLNGSGVAFARTILCLMENHQQADGSIRIPAALKKYME